MVYLKTNWTIIEFSVEYGLCCRSRALNVFNRGTSSTVATFLKTTISLIHVLDLNWNTFC